MTKKDYTQPPLDFPICIYHDCPLAKCCLHQLHYEQKCKVSNYPNIVNPTRCSKDENCIYYRNNTPVRYAQGFTKIQENLLPSQYRELSATLMGFFGRTGFYSRRKGEKLLSPREQNIVKNTLKRIGITKELEFDNYVLLPLYYD